MDTKATDQPVMLQRDENGEVRNVVCGQVSGVVVQVNGPIHGGICLTSMRGNDHE